MTWLGQMWDFVAGDAAKPEPYDMERIREMLEFLRYRDTLGLEAAQTIR